RSTRTAPEITGIASTNCGTRSAPSTRVWENHPPKTRRVPHNSTERRLRVTNLDTDSYLTIDTAVPSQYDRSSAQAIMISHKHRTAGLAMVLAVGWAGLKRVHSASAASPKAVEFFVAPEGNDGWSGRVPTPTAADGPFATIRRARDAVRAWRKTQAQPTRVR